MATNVRRILAATIFIGGAALVGSSPPANADYVPFTIADPEAGPPGTVITVSGDTWCATTTQEPGQNIQPGVPGSVLVEFGEASWPRQIANESQLDRVLASTRVDAGPDGRWTARIAVPGGTPPGDEYGVMGHCTVITTGTPASTTSTSQAGSTSTTASSTTQPPDPAAAPTRAVAQADEVLMFDFLPARFEVTEAPPASAPQGASPAEAVEGQADFTG